MGAEPSLSLGGGRTAPRRASIDRLGVVLTLLGALATGLPFAIEKANRLLPGTPHSLGAALAGAPGTRVVLLATLLAAAIAALAVARATVRLVSACLALGALTAAIATAADALTPAGNVVVRITPGAGFWLLATAAALLLADAITRLRPSALGRIGLLAAFLAAVAVVLGSGFVDHLSVMREYLVNAERFRHELGRHVELALGSLLAAALIAVPLGVACHRRPRLRAPVLGLLNVVQTVPAIALFGILMAPLAALALAFPALAELGIRGIGAGPAVIALVLYSMLPIVANTVTGLGRVAPATVEAARGMGMTGGEVLWQVEWPLALPVMLTGVRIALVQNIGLVTIAALIGGGGLGTFVFQGIGQTAIDLVLLGALPTVVLAYSAAVLFDAAIEGLGRGSA